MPGKIDTLQIIQRPFWLQDDSVRDKIAFPTGPWQRQTVCRYKPDVVSQAYMDNIYYEDPIAKASSTGFKYVQKALASIDYDINEFGIAGDSWYVYSKDEPSFRIMPYPEGAKVNAALDQAAVFVLKEQES